MASQASKDAKILARRADHLFERLAEARKNGKNLTYDRQEEAALRSVLRRLSSVDRLCCHCFSDATAKMAGDWICRNCLRERGIEV